MRDDPEGAPGRTGGTAGVGGRLPRPIRRQYLSEIIEPRAEEIFTLLRKGDPPVRLRGKPRAGVVLTGGGSRMDGLTDLGERVFKLPSGGEPDRIGDWSRS